MKQILFIQDRYTGGNPKFGFSNNLHNILGTFQQSILDAQVYTIFFDELYMFGRHVDTILPQYCQKFGIEVVFVSLLGTSPSNPSLQCLETVKKLGIKVIFIFCDANPTEIYLQNVTFNLSDLNIVLDYPTSPMHDKRRGEHLKSGKYLYLWTPEPADLYHPQTQDIDVSFIGSIRYPDRAEYCRKLQEAIPNIYIRGGQREEGKLSPEGYASLIRRSKININFCKNPDGYDQLKGRVCESLASKTLLMEERGGSTCIFFEHEVDYLGFSNVQELISRINKYLQNPDLASQIAQNGYNKFNEKYTAKHFWDIVMEKVNKL